MSNYIKLYERKVCKIPKGYEVHHIDQNRENNNILNLVLLPQELHRKYHTLLREFQNLKFDFYTKPQGIIEQGTNYNDYLLRKIKAFEEVRQECSKWVDFRNYKMGICPKVNDIEIEVI